MSPDSQKNDSEKPASEESIKDTLTAMNQILELLNTTSNSALNNPSQIDADDQNPDESISSLNLHEDLNSLNQTVKVLEYRTKIKQYISELNQALNNKTEISSQQIKKYYKFLKETLRVVAQCDSSPGLGDSLILSPNNQNTLSSSSSLINFNPYAKTSPMGVGIKGFSSYDHGHIDSDSEYDPEHESASLNYRPTLNSLRLDSMEYIKTVNKPKALDSLDPNVQFNADQNNTLQPTQSHLFPPKRPQLYSQLDSSSTPDLRMSLGSRSMSEPIENAIDKLHISPMLPENTPDLTESFTQGLFASDVVISNPYRVGTGMRSYTLYTVTAKLVKGGKLQVRKRYSEFVRLREVLCRLYPNLKKNIPQLPQKKLVGKFQAEFVENRRQGLEFFLIYVTLHPIIGANNILERWYTFK
ncbi:hypothetical protein CONCODRAFT_78788 [Conidiobolus coronatus NRRL 28638]|uniref:PX domain-containing protein n=1 Tax=Conidiobolus coronatus (strain ATCC 28846 / CBS 209.66 / NRRL 28638) TaxID=796925 RepID=A0A137P6H6_CONC2|nr:hypothetical protein CONCODRAFT_78788 [Conidiobolus coronatus NRRL 28638]|eukprot:KXN70534.1 hypothetical protein CONCODRAFT_78788 [Conidiobolus coronatus NRRL 28638]